MGLGLALLRIGPPPRPCCPHPHRIGAFVLSPRLPRRRSLLEEKRLPPAIYCGCGWGSWLKAGDYLERLDAADQQVGRHPEEHHQAKGPLLGFQPAVEAIQQVSATLAAEVHQEGGHKAGAEGEQRQHDQRHSLVTAGLAGSSDVGHGGKEEHQTGHVLGHHAEAEGEGPQVRVLGARISWSRGPPRRMEQQLDAEHQHHHPHGQPQRQGDCIGAIWAHGQGVAHGQADRQPDSHHQGVAGGK